MNSGRHLDNFTFEPLVLQYCAIPIFVVSNVHRIHLCNFSKSRSSSRSNVKKIGPLPST